MEERLTVTRGLLDLLLKRDVGQGDDAAKYLLLKNKKKIRRRKHREHLRRILELNKTISTVMIGLTERIVPRAARAPLIRPPRLRYSSVSSAT